MSRIVITGAGTEIGKTYVTCRLIEALRARGRAVGALKPVVSGFDPAAAAASDPGLILRALGQSVTSEAVAAIAPLRYAAPLAANMAARAEGKSFSFADVIALCRAREGDPLLIEGAGGVMAPVDDDHTFLDLIEALDAPAILVTGSYLGAISHTLTAVAAMAARGRAPLAVVVNESTEGVDLAQTIAAMRALSPGVNFCAIERNGAAPGALIDLIARA
jgi:dethiobiotin synthetase